jgi:hypothetical protein
VLSLYIYRIMPTALRSCLFQNNGRLRLLMPSLTEELLDGRAVLPEYAGQILRHALVSLEVDQWRKPLHITNIATSIWEFDELGDIHRALERRRTDGERPDEEDSPEPANVVHITDRIARNRWGSESNWKVGLREMNQIVFAIWRPTHRR